MIKRQKKKKRATTEPLASNHGASHRPASSRLASRSAPPPKNPYSPGRLPGCLIFQTSGVILSRCITIAQHLNRRCRRLRCLSRALGRACDLLIRLSGPPSRPSLILGFLGLLSPDCSDSAQRGCRPINKQQQASTSPTVVGCRISLSVFGVLHVVRDIFATWEADHLPLANVLLGRRLTNPCLRHYYLSALVPRPNVPLLLNIIYWNGFDISCFSRSCGNE